MSRRAKDILAVPFALASAYLAGVASVWGLGRHASEFVWWHPALALFLASAAVAGLPDFPPDEVACADCEKKRRSLTKAHPK